MQTCYNCGREVDDNVLICPDCGALVKRYGPPVHEEITVSPEEQAPDIRQNTGFDPKAGVFRDEQGKLRFRTAVKVWMVLGIIFAFYTAFSFFCVLLVFRHPETYLAPFQGIPELQGLLSTVESLMQIVGSAYAYFAIYLILQILKGALSICFLSTKRRFAFIGASGISIVLFLCTITTGTFFTALLEVLDVAVVWPMLRKRWNLLP